MAVPGVAQHGHGHVRDVVPGDRGHPPVPGRPRITPSAPTISGRKSTYRLSRRNVWRSPLPRMSSSVCQWSRPKVKVQSRRPEEARVDHPPDPGVTRRLDHVGVQPHPVGISDADTMNSVRALERPPQPLPVVVAPGGHLGPGQRRPRAPGP